MQTQDVTRTIIIKTDPSIKPLKNGTQVILSFVPLDQSALFKTQFPVVWAATGFQPDQISVMKRVWKANYFFSVAQTEDGPMVTPTTTTGSIQPGETTTLRGSRETGYHWTAPSSQSNPLTMLAKNETGMPQRLLVGTFDETGVARPTLTFPKVPGTATLTAEPTPMLYAYYSQGYQVNQIMKAAVQGTELLGKWGVNVIHLRPETTWLLYSEEGTEAPKLMLL